MSGKYLTWVLEVQEENKREKIWRKKKKPEHFPYWLKTVDCKFKKFNEFQDV